MAATEGEVIRCAENGHLFECVKLLRRCKCGEVWFAARAEPAGEVVLKIIDKAAVEARRGDDEEHKRATFDSPSVDVATLDFLNYHGHPNVVRAAGRSFVTETRLIAVLEFMPGGDLLDLVARHRRFDEPTSRHFFLQILRGLSYMHELRVAHLDLSLENIVLSRDHRVAKIIDFGLACRAELDDGGAEKASACGARGKLFYVAPEVFADGSFRPRPADVWSLGIILFIMLTGSPPMDAGPCEKDPRFPYIRDRKIGTILKAWKLDEQISAPLLDLLCGLLTVDPDRRLTLAQVEAHPWVDPHGARARVTPTAASGAGAGAGAGGGVTSAAAGRTAGQPPRAPPSGVATRRAAGRVGPVVPAVIRAGVTGSAGDITSAESLSNMPFGGVVASAGSAGSMDFGDLDDADLDMLDMPDVDMTT